MSGSPHIHFFVWILNTPKLTKEKRDEYCCWLDISVGANPADFRQQSDTFELAKKNQIHCHSKACTKYRNITCQNNFAKHFAGK